MIHKLRSNQTNKLEEMQAALSLPADVSRACYRSAMVMVLGLGCPERMEVNLESLLLASKKKNVNTQANCPGNISAGIDPCVQRSSGPYR